MATETAPEEIPQTASRYRMLRGKSISSPRALDVFCDDDKPQESAIRRLRSSSVHTLKAFRGDKNAPEVPALPLTPKSINIPLPLKLKNRDDGKGIETATKTQNTDGVHEIHLTEPVYQPPLSPLQKTKTISKRLIFGKKEAEQEPQLIAERLEVETPTQPQNTDAIDKDHLPEPVDEPPLSPLQKTKTISKRLIFGKKEAEYESQTIAERLEVEAQRSAAEKKRQDLAPLQVTTVPPSLKSKTSLFGLFSRSKKLATATPTAIPTTHPDTPSSSATTVFTSRTNSLETTSNPDSVKFPDPVERLTPTTTHSLESSPTVHMSQTFERRVAVRCQSSTINLPVSAETNAMDILLMASTMMRHHIDPASSVVVESYLMLGLERRLRRYERIRDVMNTWDKDHENSLLILSCPASMSDHDLDLDAVPNSTETPPGFTLQMYQSSRPGKWNKRWITLLENGQIYSAKTADALPGDATCIQLCHLADFDIYSPKETEIRQSVRPPKKFCYAIKSQQKSTQCPDEVNFVHFFSTDNEDTATQFYEMVHSWRSWLLVARKIALDRKMNAPAPQITFDSGISPDALCGEAKADLESPSVNSPIRIGAFEPLLDLDNIPKLAEEARKLLPLYPPKPAVAETRLEACPPPSDHAAPSTPTSNTEDQPVQSVPKGPETENCSGSSPSSMYHTSPGPIGVDASKGSSEAKETSREFDGFIFDVPEENQKPEPKSWFPSAAEHTAKLRKDEPPLVFRRPATADATLHNNQRRGNPPPPTSARFLELPRPFEQFGIPPPKHGSKPAPIYKLPGTPMIPSAPRARPLPRANSGVPGDGEPQHAMRPRSRSTAMSGSNRRHTAGKMPPVPPLPNRSMVRDAPSQASRASLPPQPLYPPPQVPASQPSSEEQS